MNITERQIIAIDRALNVGVTVQLKGLDFVFTALELQDVATIVQWRKDAHLRSYLESTKTVKVERGTRFADIYDIQHRASRKEDCSPRDPEGLAFMAWLSLKQHHTEMTLVEVTKLVSDGEMAELIADTLKIGSGVDETGNPTGEKDGTS